MEENRKYFFCTWSNSPVRAKILSRFQFEGKNDVWISQVRRVKLTLLMQLQNNHLTIVLLAWLNMLHVQVIEPQRLI